MKNQRISLQEYYATLMKDFGVLYTSFATPLPREGFITYFGGRQVIPVCDEFILFECCEWCGSKVRPEKGLYGYWYCGSCGGPL